MVTGSPPFDGESSQQVVGKHIADPPPAASDVNPKVPRELSDVILRCLEKQPSDRFQSAGEVIAELESDKQPSPMSSRASAAQAATELLVSGARTVPNARRHVGTSARPRRIGWGILAIALPVLALGAGALFFRQPTLVFAKSPGGMGAGEGGGGGGRLLPGGAVNLKVRPGRPPELGWEP